MRRGLLIMGLSLGLVPVLAVAFVAGMVWNIRMLQSKPTDFTVVRTGTNPTGDLTASVGWGWENMNLAVYLLVRHIRYGEVLRVRLLYGMPSIVHVEGEFKGVRWVGRDELVLALDRRYYFGPDRYKITVPARLARMEDGSR